MTLAGAAAVLTSLLVHGRIDWPQLAIILAAGAVAHAFAVKTPGNQVFHSGLAFAVAAAVLLPPQGIVLVCIAQHATDWVRQRYPWYIQSFNIANYTLSALTAWAVHDALVGLGPMSSPGVGRVLAASACGATFVFVNHAMLAPMLKLARGHSLEATGLFAFDGRAHGPRPGRDRHQLRLHLRRTRLAAVIALAACRPPARARGAQSSGAGLPGSQDRASERTGHRRRADEELPRALRFARPLSLIICDIDGLRSINNRYGHLAGDAVLIAVADTFNASFATTISAGASAATSLWSSCPRPGEPALEIAQRVEDAEPRRTISAGRTEFSVSLSIGVATTTAGHEFRLETLLAEADAAMYETKRALLTRRSD